MTVSVSVVVPTWRRPDELGHCLEALDRQSRPPEEVAVVVRPDDRETHALLKGRLSDGGPLRVVTVTEPGLVAALRAGSQAARGEVVAFTDDDAVPDPDWVARLAAHFDEDERLGAVGGRDRLAGNTDPPFPSDRVGRVRWYGRRVGEHHRGEGPPSRTDVLKGVNMAFRASALAPVQFDTRLAGVGAQHHSELAACLGVKRAGWDVLYDPEVAVDHNEGPRYGPTLRGFRDLSHLTDASHNETYALLRWLPWWRKPVALLYGLVVGYRETPGLVTAAEQAVRGGERRHVARRWGAAFRGRLRAVATWVGVLWDSR
jgi:GT2 family glycosyltransferase